MSISSAIPDDLNKFVQEASPSTDTLSGQISQLIAAANAPLGTAASVDAGGVNGTLTQFVRQNHLDERFVKAVHDAFVKADSGTIPDSLIAAQLQQEGVSTAIPSVPTIDSPTLSGLPLSSGWSNDPVCMATGHFVEVETDLPMPASISPLAWERTYNSRFIVDGPLGRGWSSWADAVLVEAADRTAQYRGPDGQLAVWVPHGDGFLPNPAVAAELRRTAEGLDLCWQWRSRRPGARWSFGRDGRLLEMSQPGRGSVRAAYEDGRLVELAHAGGRRVHLEWSGARVVKVSSSDGRSVEYGYQGDDLVSGRRPAGTVQYRVDEGGRIEDVRDADGVRVVHNEYDADGRVVVQESALGRITHFDYLGGLTVLVRDEQQGPKTLFRHDLLGRLIELTTAEGSRLVREYDRDGNPLRVVGLGGDETLRRFDDQGNTVWVRNPAGGEEWYSYDEQGRLASRTDAAGAEFRFSYEGDDPVPSEVTGPLGWRCRYRVVDGRIAGVVDADGVRWDLELDADGQVTSVTDGTGARTLVEWHPSGEMTAVVTPSGHRHAIARDDAGRTVQVRTAAGTEYRSEWSDAGRPRLLIGPDGARVEMRYGSDGELAEVVDPLGGVTSLEHDVLGRLVGGRQPNGAEWRFGFNGLGLPTSITDPTGAVWRQHWDAAGRFVGVADPTGYLVQRRYDPAGRLTGVELPSGGRYQMDYDATGGAEIRDQLGRAAGRVERDVLGRVVAVTDEVGRTVRYTYSPAGRVTSATVRRETWRYRYDRAGRLSEVVAPGGGRQEVAYDADGRPVIIRSASGELRMAEWDADGRLRKVVGPGRSVTSVGYDAGGRVSSVADGGGAAIRYRYDAAGRLVEVVDALGGRTGWQRDPVGAITAVTDAKGATWSWELDPAGRPVASVDPLGRRSEFVRNEAGIPVAWRGPDGSGLDYAWDADGHLAEITTGGRVVWRADHDGPARRARFAGAASEPVEEVRDAAGRLTRRQAGRRVTTWQYDDDAGTVTVSTPAGERIVKTLDAAGRAVRVAHPAVGEIRARYDDEGRAVEVVGDRVRRTWTYTDGHLSSYHEQVDGSDRSVVLERDDVGRIVREDRDGEVRTFAYDRAGQLVGAGGPDGGWGWRYDQCGRLVEEVSPSGVRRFEYDAADQLVSWSGPAGTVRVSWDGRGRRVAERHPEGEVRYQWDELGRLAGVHDGRTGTSTTVVTDASGRVSRVGTTAVDWSGDTPLDGRPLGLGDQAVVDVAGRPVAVVAGGSARYLQVGWRGDVAAAADAWGAGANPAAGRSEVGLGFLGELEVGPLLWLRNRAYDPSTHSFLSRDPLAGLLGTPGGQTNPYGYAANNPWSWADPVGLRPMSIADYNAWRAQEQAGAWKSVVEWAGVAAVVVGSVALIACTGGAAIPVLAGVGGLLGVGGTALDQAINGGRFDPAGLLLGGASGMVIGAASGFVPGLLVPEGSSALRFLGTQALTMGSASALTNMGTQQLLYNRVDWGTVALAGGAGTLAGLLPGAIPGAETEAAATETFYRTMSKANFEQLQATGRIPATSETFISPSGAYASNYEGVTVRFSVRGGTTDALVKVGVRDNSALTAAAYPDMPPVSSGWASTSAYFKGEGGVINIGLGRGTALDIFNKGIVGRDVMP